MRPLWGGGFRRAEPLQLGRDWPTCGKEKLEGWEEKGLGFQGGLEKGEQEEKLWEEASTTSPVRAISCSSWPGTVWTLTPKAPHPRTAGHSTLKPAGARMGQAGRASRPDSFPPTPHLPILPSTVEGLLGIQGWCRGLGSERCFLVLGLYACICDLGTVRVSTHSPRTPSPGPQGAPGLGRERGADSQLCPYLLTSSPVGQALQEELDKMMASGEPRGCLGGDKPHPWRRTTASQALWWVALRGPL